MKKNTRQEILETAKKLFNEHGYNGVSLRDISGAMGISKGNLTYHFSKKEEIMEALLESNTDTSPTKAPTSIQELDEFFLDMQKAVQENAYYFLHYTQLSQLSQTIRQKQAAKFSKKICFLKESFVLLNANGFLRNEGYLGEYGEFIECLHISSIYWQSLSSLRTTDSRKTYRLHAWGLMHNLLTEKGKSVLAEIVELYYR